MIRKVLGTSLAVAAAAAAVGGAVSYGRTVYRDFRLTDRALVYVHLSDGLFRIGLTVASKPIGFSPRLRNSGHRQRAAGLRGPVHPGATNDSLSVQNRYGEQCCELVFPNRAYLRWPGTGYTGSQLTGAWGWRLPTGAPECGSLRLWFLRSPAWLPPLLFIAYPTIALIARRRHRRQGSKTAVRCRRCGYHLGSHGFSTCPECGLPRRVRTSIIAVLTLLAIGTAALWTLSYTSCPPSNGIFGDGWLVWGSRPGLNVIFRPDDDRELDCHVRSGRMGLRFRTILDHTAIDSERTIGFGLAHVSKRILGPFRYIRLYVVTTVKETWAPPGVELRRATVPALVQFLQAPLWAPFVLFAAWPIVAFFRGPIRRRRRRRRRQHGRCACCGHNLTGLVESRCPECGTSFEKG